MRALFLSAASWLLAAGSLHAAPGLRIAVDAPDYDLVGGRQYQLKVHLKNTRRLRSLRRS
jgi:hypothetical protein